jgi:hypothetical protein
MSEFTRQLSMFLLVWILFDARQKNMRRCVNKPNRLNERSNNTLFIGGRIVCKHFWMMLMCQLNFTIHLIAKSLSGSKTANCMCICAPYRLWCMCFVLRFNRSLIARARSLIIIIFSMYRYRWVYPVPGVMSPQLSQYTRRIQMHLSSKSKTTR